MARNCTNKSTERQQHFDALARMDALFDKFGISVATPAPVTAAVAVAPAPAKVAKSRKRRHFAQTGEEFVLSQLAGESLVTADINKAWIAAGRKGNTDNTLYIMTKKKALKRVQVKVGMGSVYSVA